MSGPRVHASVVALDLLRMGFSARSGDLSGWRCGPRRSGR
jgi:hypothetical protein